MHARRRTTPLPVLASAAVLAAACKVGPDYEPPEIDESVVTEDFGATEDPAFDASQTDIKEWWTVFEDPQLTSLIARAEEGNKDLAIAVSRVSEARARLGFAKAGKYPQVGISGGIQAADDVFTGYETRTRTSIGADVSWELDVFGRVARQIESADAEFQATQEDQRDVQVSLFAEVARAYIGVRALQMQLESAQRNIDSQREILTLTQARVSSGISSDLDVARAVSILAASEASVPPLRINLAREVNTLGLLVGQNPTALQDELAEPQEIPVPPASSAVGVPADLLRQRPDIRAAERRLAAQTARVGIATADLYPTFGIDGTLGLNTIGGADLFDPGSRNIALGPSRRWTRFDGGRRKAQIAAEDAGVRQAALLYERAILSALEEVETSMTTFTEQGVRVSTLERGANAAEEALRLATVLYQDGLIDYEQVLDVQRTAITQEIEVFNARGQAASSVVLLYRALGGGWDPSEEVTGEEPETSTAP